MALSLYTWFLLEQKNWSKQIGMFLIFSLFGAFAHQPWFKGHAHLEGHVHQVWLIDVTRNETTHFLANGRACQLGS